ncbi:hypothetical protein K7432_000219 [Basidiobolus ranarum]|uniref:Uncharacterized protein n=1 Tax=Basidiobolus ranarum TaxID=34480 RepID=A0ABR2WBJ2_9FUNG
MKLSLLLTLLGISFISAQNDPVTSQVSGLTTIVFTSTLPVAQMATLFSEKPKTTKGKGKGSKTHTQEVTKTQASDISTTTNAPAGRETTTIPDSTTGDGTSTIGRATSSLAGTVVTDVPSLTVTVSTAGDLRPSVGLSSSDASITFERSIVSVCFLFVTILLI